ncbi:MAG TPA: cobyrinate a,c-diamide synthase [Polyangia bacterium]|nr:cobyrinate a,c-diamide synthase [Polyangia bacterium]
MAAAIPRLVVAGTASGVGKTTVMVALTEALRRRGRRVAVFKCGPDYLDPTYHARASGGACHNLDGWMMGREAVLQTFARGSAGADVALIEGVMGLYDGASPDSDEGSAAEIAKWLDAPVLAVVDASGMARTVAAIALGLAAFDPALRIGGLFANRVGSTGHLDILRSACARRGVAPVLGGLPDEPGLAFPERHLGLRTADRAAVPDEKLAAWGALVEKMTDPLALERLAQSAPALDVPAPGERERAPRRCRVALADDAAFHFYYDDNLRRLEALGAELVRFSPIADARLPPADGVYLGGGYPEAHAAALAANRSMRESLRAFAASGAPVYAECGGLMYLSRAIRTLDGREHEMVGLVPGVAVMSDRLQALGYVEVETQRRTILGGAGLRLRGHQFRYSTLEGADGGGAYSVRRRRGGATHVEGYGGENVLASYVHAHWASNPLCAEGFVASCAARAGAHR